MASSPAALQVSRRGVAPSPALLRWLVPFGWILAGLLAFGVFVALIGRNPIEVYATILDGGFASSFAWNNTLLRAAPLILTGLAVAIPAQATRKGMAGRGCSPVIRMQVLKSQNNGKYHPRSGLPHSANWPRPFCC